MKIAIGCDHAGPELKAEILAHLDEKGVEYTDFGIQAGEKVDYPDKAKEVCEKVASGEYEMGILICGTGIGMSMSANKIKGIRAACCSDYFSAKYTRAHNDANVLCIGARVLGAGLAIELVDVFLETEFEGGRHEIVGYRFDGKNGKSKIPFKLKRDKHYMITFIPKNRFGQTDAFQIVSEFDFSKNTNKDIGICNIIQDW